MHLRIKESLRKQFAELANNFERRLSAISSELAAIEGPLEVNSNVNLHPGHALKPSRNRKNSFAAYKPNCPPSRKRSLRLLKQKTNVTPLTWKRTITQYSRFRI